MPRLFISSGSPSLLQYPIAIVDLETTGLKPLQDRVIEVGICLLDEGRLVEEWSSLVNPGVPISPFIQQHTGISNAMVRQAPSFEEILEEVLARVDGRVLVAHNAPFDYGFLRHEFHRCGITFSAGTLCTVRLSRALCPREKRHGLDALIQRFGLSCAARHRALDDARAVWHLLQAFYCEFDREKIITAAGTLLKKPSVDPLYLPPPVNPESLGAATPKPLSSPAPESLPSPAPFVPLP